MHLGNITEPLLPLVSASKSCSGKLLPSVHPPSNVGFLSEATSRSKPQRVFLPKFIQVLVGSVLNPSALLQAVGVARRSRWWNGTNSGVMINWKAETQTHLEAWSFFASKVSSPSRPLRSGRLKLQIQDLVLNLACHG